MSGQLPTRRPSEQRSTRLRGLRGIPCRFEVVTGDPTPTLLELTRGAAALIVGTDEGTGRTIARRCVAHAECPVVTVPDQRCLTSPTHDDPGQRCRTRGT
jgi:hypothetical protein